MNMPTYEYQCDACDHRFDEMQSFSEPPLTKCPACGKKKLRRLFGTGAAVLFKGSGFYETDYRSESYKSGQKAEADAAKPAEANNGDGAAEAKPAAPAPAPKTGKAGKAKAAAKDD
jgi:putative FmdB family regulatory protein